MLDFFIPALLVGISAYVFADVLTQSGEIFARYGDWLYCNSGKWWAKPLGYCGKCFAGQLALWTYLFTPCYAGPFDHAAFISLSIYTYLIAKKWAT